LLKLNSSLCFCHSRAGGNPLVTNKVERDNSIKSNMNFLEKIKIDLVKEINKILGGESIAVSDFEYPPEGIGGDLSLPCFNLAKQKKKSPVELAKEIAEKIKPGKNIAKIEPTGLYLNFFLNQEETAKTVLEEILKEKEKYGENKTGKNKKVMIEFSNANTHKEYHVGHLRNLCYGDAVNKILSANGYKSIPVSYINDFGIHVAKTLWAYDKFYTKEKIPKNKGHFLGEIYARAVKEIGESEELKKEVGELMSKIENRKGKEYKQWEKTRQWSIKQFSAIYKQLDVKFDNIFYESEVIDEGRKMVDELLLKKVLIKSRGAIIANLEKDNLGVLMFLRSDGTALYPVADIPLAIEKFKKYKLDKSIYVVDVRQGLYFKQLFKVLSQLGFKQEMIHLGYEFVKLSSRMMSSRTGNVITYETLWEEAMERAKSETKVRHENWSEKQIKAVAEKIVIGAIKFEMIKVGKEKIITFDANEALRFEGFTAAYIQYTYARICSILRKAGAAKKIKFLKINFESLKEVNEHKLSMALAKFSEAIEKSAIVYNPAILAEYLHNLAKCFNDFYRDVPVLKADNEVRLARVALLEATRIVLLRGLSLLGIEAPERM